MRLSNGYLGHYNFEFNDAITKLTDPYYSWYENEKTLETCIRLALLEAFIDI